MADASLLAHLASRLTNQTELLATEALGYGRYLRIGHEGARAQARFQVNYNRWATQKETPLWFVLIDSPDMPMGKIEERLGDGYLGFDLPVNVEYEAVLEAVVKKLHDVANSLATA